MAKQELEPPFDSLERELIETMHAGLRGARPDLQYPASFSDIQSMVRNVLCRYKVVKLPQSRGILYNEVQI